MGQEVAEHSRLPHRMWIVFDLAVCSIHIFPSWNEKFISNGTRWAQNFISDMRINNFASYVADERIFSPEKNSNALWFSEQTDNDSNKYVWSTFLFFKVLLHELQLYLDPFQT